MRDASSARTRSREYRRSGGDRKGKSTARATSLLAACLAPGAEAAAAFRSMSTAAWGLHCGACQALVARHEHVTFLRESERSVYLVLRETALDDEQARAPPGEERDAWRVRVGDADADADGGAWITKKRTTNAGKRGSFPFELYCAACDGGLGSQGVVGNVTELVMALSAKKCAYKIDQAVPQPLALAMAGARKRTWPVALQHLKELNLPLHECTVAEFMEGDADSSSSRSASELQVVEPMVFPTETSIRAGFSASAKMTTMRQYQVELALSALLNNTIVYLPTGRAVRYCTCCDCAVLTTCLL